jgi:sec-independent protein translocase protein TatC
MDHIFFGPTRNNFLTFRVVNHFSQMILGENSIHLPKEFPVRVSKLYQQFNVMMAVSIFGGMVAAFPYIVGNFGDLSVLHYIPKKEKFNPYHQFCLDFL